MTNQAFNLLNKKNCVSIPNKINIEVSGMENPKYELETKENSEYQLYDSKKFLQENKVEKEILFKLTNIYQDQIEQKFDDFVNKSKIQAKNLVSNDSDNNFIQFNKNLLEINLLKSKYYNIKSDLDNPNKKDKLKFKLWNKSYFSSLSSIIKNNIGSRPSKINTFLDNKLILKNPEKSYLKRYRKSQQEVDYLEEYFEFNNHKWNHNTIHELSKKLNLSKYSIYKWNWQKIKNLHDNQ